MACNIQIPVTIELAQYEDFTRDSERLNTVKDYIRNSERPCMSVICAILEVKPKVVDK